MPRREDHEVRQGHVGHWIKKKKTLCYIMQPLGVEELKYSSPENRERKFS